LKDKRLCLDVESGFNGEQLHACAATATPQSIVAINVRKKYKKNVKKLVFYPKNKKNVCKRDNKRYPLFYLLLM